MGNQPNNKPFQISCNSFTTKGGNVVWAAAMQLAWNEFRSQFASNKPIKMHTGNEKSLEIINKFNAGQFDKSNIDPGCVYVKSGYGQATLNTINTQVARKFPKKSIPPFNGPLADTDIISYAYLSKEIIFDVKFERTQKLQFTFNGTPVKSFYGKTAEQNKQILVHYYIDSFSFMVEIRGKNKNDSLFLIKNPKIKTIQQALKESVVESKANAEPLKKGDMFQMPVVNLSVQRQYKQLIGLPFANEQLKQYFIRIMFEVIKLNIDESGAKVENEAVMVATRCKMMLSEQEPKMIVLDQSFWIVMKESGKNPYICVLINSPEDIAS